MTDLRSDASLQNDAGATEAVDWEMVSSQIRLLTYAIEAEPDAPVNYLLRAEEWLARGQVTWARSDFDMARALYEEALENSAWGYVYQYGLDRANVGLRQCDMVLDVVTARQLFGL
ncbi:MAG: hypothetical protein JW966_00595 [Anaerolineae bacterium]|nr:hypothetical protein [Anaerolineae bacterium]